MEAVKAVQKLGLTLPEELDRIQQTLPSLAERIKATANVQVMTGGILSMTKDEQTKLLRVKLELPDETKKLSVQPSEEGTLEVDRVTTKHKTFKEYERKDLWDNKYELRPCVADTAMTYEALTDKLCRRPNGRDIYMEPAGAKFRDSLDFVAQERPWMLIEEDKVCCPKNITDVGTGTSGYTFGLGTKLLNAGYKCRALTMYCKGFIAGIQITELEAEMYKRSNICRYHINTSMGCYHQPDCTFAHPDHLAGINEKYYSEQMKLYKMSKDKPEKPKHMKYLGDL